MKNWLIPAIVLLAIAGAGMGVGWSVNEWQDGGQSAPPTEQSTPAAATGPTEAELDAQRCGAALEAAGNAQPGPSRRVDTGELTAWGQIQQAVSRYCH